MLIFACTKTKQLLSTTLACSLVAVRYNRNCFHTWRTKQLISVLYSSTHAIAHSVTLAHFCSRPRLVCSRFMIDLPARLEPKGLGTCCHRSHVREQVFIHVRIARRIVESHTTRATVALLPTIIDASLSITHTWYQDSEPK